MGNPEAGGRAIGVIFPLLIFATVAASGTPAPLSVGPLKEIVQAHGSGACGVVVVHANAAIAAVLRDDQLLARTIGHMHSANLEGGAQLWHESMNDLEHLATELHASSTQGIGEIDRLRDISAKPGDATERSALKSFADALGNALDRQAKIGSDLDRVLTSLYRQSMRGPSGQDFDNMEGTTDPSNTNGQSGEPGVQRLSSQGASPNTTLSAAAAEFQARIPDIAHDEVKAAEHSEGAVSGC